MKEYLRAMAKDLVHKFATLWHSHSFTPYIDHNDGLERLMHKPLIGWVNYHQRHVVGTDTRFLGHRALKNPMDAWVYQEIISEVKPDVVFELGNKNGGSTLYLASVLEALGHGRVLALDLDHSVFTVSHPRIDTMEGDSTDPAVIRQVHDYCEGKTCLMIHDAIHTSEGVLRDLNNYQDLISPPSYLIVEDTCEGLPGFIIADPADRYKTFWRPHKDTALQAVRAFVDANRRFVIDRQREKWILTSNPFGYLKCITAERH